MAKMLVQADGTQIPTRIPYKSSKWWILLLLIMFVVGLYVNYLGFYDMGSLIADKPENSKFPGWFDRGLMYNFFTTIITVAVIIVLSIGKPNPELSQR
jgi:hypothetical protein